MPRIKLNAPPENQQQRRDTIGLRSVVKYDPMAPRPTTPVMVGQYVVARRPLSDSIYTLYMILDGATIVRTQISYPSEDDCASAVQRHRTAQAASMAEKTIAKAKTRRAQPPVAEVA
ncbi:beta-hexosaminidase [Paraburkholderia pallida]|uniref:Beta-hexosaminidase n=1 Tax=Paraburkholderia pallida TaxID=2547399 RepID=A0A4P7CQN2_9BURK|nr:beta-hexosaminidase [Paraburkholderia pallida]QBQ98188.1 beta-hexosaminidase [Paraburkholderia pallida]